MYGGAPDVRGGGSATRMRAGKAEKRLAAQRAAQRGAGRGAGRRPVQQSFTERHQNSLILGGILLLTVLIYANSIGNGFVDFDDPENVMDNYSIRELTFDNVAHWFTTPLQFMYTPLAYLSYAIDYQIGGLSPQMYHVTNLVLHLVNVVLVYLVVSRLIGRPFVAHVVAVAFAVHPVNVDSISWVATRTNLLVSLFTLAALLVYLRYVESKRWLHLGIAVGLFALSGLAKSSGAVLPLTLFLIDYLRGRGWSWRLLLEKIPFFAIAVGIGLVTLQFRDDTINPHGYNLLDRVILICASLVAYLIRLFWPTDLALAYDYPDKVGGALPWHLYLAPLVLIAVGYALWRLREHRRVVVFGVGFFLVNILLTQTVWLIDNYQANRYAYLPYIGLFLILAVLIERVLAVAPQWRLPHANTIIGGVLVAAMFAFCVLTVVRNSVWQNTITVMSDSISKEPGVAFVHNNRGVARNKAGDQAGARADFEKALQVDPDFMLARYYLATIKHDNGDYQGALADFDAIMPTYGTFAAGYNARAKTKNALRDFSGALDDANMAISLDPYMVDAYHNRGVAEAAMSFLPESLRDFDKAIGMFPDFADAYFHRASTKARLGDIPGGCADMLKAQQLGHKDAPTVYQQNCAGQ
jgi:tetratricopeptide (TPR) repeat protein